MRLSTWYVPLAQGTMVIAGFCASPRCGRTGPASRTGRPRWGWGSATFAALVGGGSAVPRRCPRRCCCRGSAAPAVCRGHRGSAGQHDHDGDDRGVPRDFGGGTTAAPRGLSAEYGVDNVRRVAPATSTWLPAPARCAAGVFWLPHGSAGSGRAPRSTPDHGSTAGRATGRSATSGSSRRGFADVTVAWTLADRSRNRADQESSR